MNTPLPAAEQNSATVAELQRLNRELESMLQMVTHDLKSPISVILGVADLIETDFASFLNQDGKDYLRMVRHEANRMLRLIQDVLSFTRVEARKLEKTQVDTLSMVNMIVSEFQHIYRETPVVFIIQESMPTILAQQTLMVEVFKNLISNAIKYADPTKTNAMVEIGSREKDGLCHFFVRDNGIGMTPEQSCHVFEPFYRAGQKVVEGNGLGTAITRRIIEAHGGKIWLESNLGAGSVFTFSFPVEG